MMASTAHRFLKAVWRRHLHTTLPKGMQRPDARRLYLLYLGLVLLAVLLACAQAKSPRPHVQYGQASWYGDTFHGRQTASGETYDMSQLTAAHRQAPLGSYAVVTNVENGRSVRVRINDRGPFKKGRIIDLSHAAADQLDMLEAGTARVKVEFLPDSAPAATFVVQAGAYRQQSNAARVQRDLVAHYPTARITQSSTGAQSLFRIHLGPFATRDKAEHVARGVKALGYTSTVLPLP